MIKQNIIVVLFLIKAVFNSQAQQITPISDEEFNSSSFESLSFLKEELKDVKVLGLGEALHFMGGTYTAKVKMAKFLHEKCGFDVIAFESPLYNLSKVSDQIIEGAATKDTLVKHISGVWKTAEMLELFEYILETRKTDRPLEYTGFDESFFRVKENHDLVEDYSIFVEKLKKESKIDISVDSTFYSIIETIARKSYSFSKIDPVDTTLVYNKFKEVRSSLEMVNYKDDSYYYFWKLMTDNLQSVYRKNYKIGNREERMAENVKFLIEEKYPKKKIMLWAATVHLLPNTNAIKPYRESKSYRLKKKKMGGYLKDMLGDQYYLLAFNPMQGKSGFKGYLGIAKTKVKSKKGNIGYYINEKYNANFAYIPLRNTNVIDELSRNNVEEANIVWIKGGKFNGEEMDISRAVDAIFYLKDEKLITPISE